MKKEAFLANPQNKAAFIQLLGVQLNAIGITVHYARGDADLLIVCSAIELAKENQFLNTLLCKRIRKICHELEMKTCYKFLQEETQVLMVNHYANRVNYLDIRDLQQGYKSVFSILLNRHHSSA
ncbi:hypothetical protein CAPTEDRAFT_202440 [Capitella teleta]|uniref:Uncharacterized protein n=1 Tax=Capitella teleta TaxID=283909 RepID=R7U051_CAPTE|nr:hypothetical protein CAPTEDRAFT_202440 [Capitella teleta]|eukprot:ELT99237.1 hypothetical protein CAPTEDRAFT_202440 [Capitella teleta]